MTYRNYCSEPATLPDPCPPAGGFNDTLIQQLIEKLNETITNQETLIDRIETVDHSETVIPIPNQPCWVDAVGDPVSDVFSVIVDGAVKTYSKTGDANGDLVDLTGTLTQVPCDEPDPPVTLIPLPFQPCWQDNNGDIVDAHGFMLSDGTLKVYSVTADVNGQLTDLTGTVTAVTCPPNDVERIIPVPDSAQPCWADSDGAVLDNVFTIQVDGVTKVFKVVDADTPLVDVTSLVTAVDCCEPCPDDDSTDDDTTTVTFGGANPESQFLEFLTKLTEHGDVTLVDGDEVSDE